MATRASISAKEEAKEAEKAEDGLEVEWAAWAAWVAWVGRAAPAVAGRARSRWGVSTPSPVPLRFPPWIESWDCMGLGPEVNELNAGEDVEGEKVENECPGPEKEEVGNALVVVAGVVVAAVVAAAVRPTRPIAAAAVLGTRVRAAAEPGLALLLDRTSGVAPGVAPGVRTGVTPKDRAPDLDPAAPGVVNDWEPLGLDRAPAVPGRTRCWGE